MKDISEREFKQLTDYIKTRYGINLTHKKTLVVGRLQNYLVNNNFASFSDYYDYVVADKTGNAASLLVNTLSTNHTFFMREWDHFEFFRNTVLPYLAASESTKKDLRLWSAGCST